MVDFSPAVSINRLSSANPTYLFSQIDCVGHGGTSARIGVRTTFFALHPSEVHHRTISLLREAGGIFRVGTPAESKLNGSGSLDVTFERQRFGRRVDPRKECKSAANLERSCSMSVRSDSSCIWISCPRYSPAAKRGGSLVGNSSACEWSPRSRRRSILLRRVQLRTSGSAKGRRPAFRGIGTQKESSEGCALAGIVLHRAAGYGSDLGQSSMPTV